MDDAQLAQLYSLTHDARFAAWAARFAADYPQDVAHGHINVLKDVEYFVIQPHQLQVAHLGLPNVGSVFIDRRIIVKRFPGTIWYHVAEGPYTDWLIKETAAFNLPGKYSTAPYVPSVKFIFPTGPYTTYKYTGSDLQVGATRYLGGPTTYSVHESTVINGQILWQIDDLSQSSTTVPGGATYLWVGVLRPTIEGNSSVPTPGRT